MADPGRSLAEQVNDHAALEHAESMTAVAEFTCRICGNHENNTPYQGCEMMFGTRECFPYFQCGACGCLQIARVPDDLSRYYPPEYYSLGGDIPALFRNRVRNALWRHRCSYAVLDRGLLGRLLYARFPDRPLRALALAGVGRSARILDVGCGSGYLLAQLKNAGFDNLLGIDPFLDGDRRYPNGLTLRKATVHELDGCWDLIMFHHVFEHLPDPLETLQACRRLLAPGGSCLLTMPTVSSFHWEHYRMHWAQTDPPRHLYVHSRDSLDHLADQAGFVVERVRYDSFEFGFILSEQRLQGIAMYAPNSYYSDRSRSNFRPRDIRAWRRRAQALNRQNRGDQAAFLLRPLP